jgi:hypothetical protein
MQFVAFQAPGQSDRRYARSARARTRGNCRSVTSGCPCSALMGFVLRPLSHRSPPITHQPTALGEISDSIDRGHCVAGRKRDTLLTPSDEERVRDHGRCINGNILRDASRPCRVRSRSSSKKNATGGGTACGAGRTTESWAARDKCGNRHYLGICQVFRLDSIR